MPDRPTITVEGRRVYITTPYGHPAVEPLRTLGVRWDRESRRWWTGAAKREAVERIVAAAEVAPPAPEDPDKIRLLGKAELRGRALFIRARTAGRGGPDRVRLCSLDLALDVWAPVGAAEGEARILKLYPTADVTGRGRFGSGARQPITLGSIRRFVERERAAEARGEPACPGCGRHLPLILDLEDGIDKCRSCCDMPEC